MELGWLEGLAQQAAGQWTDRGQRRFGRQVPGILLGDLGQGLGFRRKS